jgi:cytochrome c oxidase accessory protein FixG
MKALEPNDFIYADAGSSEAAPGIARHDVDAVNRDVSAQFYASRAAIHPKQVHGTFRRAKWIVMAVTLGIYYALPWLRWNRGPDLPDQAVLLDLSNNRYFLFFLEIWPQEFYFVTGLLILAALGLFLVTSIAGRVWCGYTCPQTVWTDLMIAVERFWQGDRNDRMRLDKEPWGPRKLALKTMTHVSWLAVGLATGGAFVFYFRDAPTLARELVTGEAPPVAYVFVGIFTLSTYVLGGLAREQVCIYMCPWPRIQGAMTDHHTLLVSYRAQRGEPRGPHKKGSSWVGRGDCIDCKACVAACPTGIDIRDGSQLACIQCALCIDACNDIMDKVGRPRGLVAYDTILRHGEGAAGLAGALRLVRPRTLLYAALIAVVGTVMVAAWLKRSLVEINVLHDRNPPFVQLTDGSVRNGYTVKLLNKRHEPRIFALHVDGLPSAKVTAVGADVADGRVKVPTDDVREIRVLVSLPLDDVARLAGVSAPFKMTLEDVDSGDRPAHAANFQFAPGR